MRFSIGFKIFGIAVILAGVMIAAAIISEIRVRQAQVRIEVLAEHLLTLMEKSNDLRTIALQETLEFRDLISSEASGDSSEEQRIEQLYEASFREFIAVSKDMLSEIDAATAKIPTTERKLELSNIKVHLGSLVSTHEHLHELIKRIVDLHAEGNEVAKAELVRLFNIEDEAFLAADTELVMQIRLVVDSVAQTAEKDQAQAIAFEHIVTATAALLGLLLAGIMTRALLLPIRNLRRASMAVQAGDFRQQVDVRGNDELTDLSTTFNTMVEQLKQKEKTEAVFGRYVDPRVIEKLVDETGENADDLAAAGRQEATVFFSDIAGYTGISERLTPASLVQLMNEYFNMAGIPIAKSNGLLDKFIGDAVMAFWCPPFVDSEDIAKLACQAVIGEAAMIREFQKRLPDLTGIRIGVPEISIRMGLATGNVIVGSIGSANKRNYTVIGDTVNLSSRLEGANKFYGTQSLICERTHELMGTGFVTRELDKLIVKGKTNAIRIFELVSEGTPDPDTADAFGAFASGLQLYREGDWNKASDLFNDCLKARPDDQPSKIFLKRIEQLKENPPGPDWSGVWQLDAK